MLTIKHICITFIIILNLNDFNSLENLIAENLARQNHTFDLTISPKAPENCECILKSFFFLIDFAFLHLIKQ